MPADNEPSRTLNGQISRKGTQPAKRRVTNRAGRTHQHPDSEAKLRLRELLGDELDSAAGRLVLDTVDENRLGLTKSLWREA